MRIYVGSAEPLELTEKLEALAWLDWLGGKGGEIRLTGNAFL
jgi:hypothetical protein